MGGDSAAAWKPAVWRRESSSGSRWLEPELHSGDGRQMSISQTLPGEPAKCVHVSQLLIAANRAPQRIVANDKNGHFLVHRGEKTPKWPNIIFLIFKNFVSLHSFSLNFNILHVDVGI